MFFEIWWTINLQIFLHYWGWFEFLKHLDTWKHITCWIFMSLKSIVRSLNWLRLECLHASVYGSHSVKYANIERKNIFIHVYPQLFIYLFVKFGLCIFSFPHLLNFPQNYFFQNLFCFSYFYWGRKLFFFKPMLFFRGVVALHKGSCIYFL